MPAIAIAENEAGAGSQLSYGSAPQKQYVRGVAYVDRILRGAKPGELPIEQPTIFQFAVNLKTAKVLGITPPPSIMVRVDKVIE